MTTPETYDPCPDCHPIPWPVFILGAPSKDDLDFIFETGIIAYVLPECQVCRKC